MLRLSQLAHEAQSLERAWSAIDQVADEPEAIGGRVETEQVEQPDDKRDWPPLILESSAGGFLYSTTDMATVEMRVDELFELDEEG